MAHALVCFLTQSCQLFARRLQRYLEKHRRMHTSVLVGMNNKIKVIKRMVYGYRGNDYFFKKIKAAFPGKVR